MNRGYESGVTPLFSILVPVYNVQSFLPETFTSIQGQTFGGYEVILVDDGSTDGSGGLCDEFVLERRNATVIHQENMGLLLARRAALRQARGEYIVTLDSDDALRTDALELLAGVIEAHRPDIIAFEYSRARDFRSFGPSRLPVTPGYHDGSQYRKFLDVVCHGKHNNVWSKCYRRAIADVDADYSMHRGLTHAEDLLQLVPLAAAAHNFYYLDEPLYYYRPNPHSSTAAYRRKQLDDLSVALDALLLAAEAWGDTCLDEARRGALMQVNYLIHILVMSNMDEREKLDELAAIRAYALQSGLLGPWCDALRLDKRLEINALRRGDLRRLSRIVHALMIVKRARDRHFGAADDGGSHA